MTTIQTTILGVAAAVALSAQEPADMFFAAPMQVRAATAPTFEFINGGMLGGNAVKGAPYSAQAVTESAQTLGDGNRIVNRSTSTVARDTEGRERREQSLANLGPFAAQGDPAQIVFITDPVAGVNYSLNSKEKTAIKLPIPVFPSDMPGLPGPPIGLEAGGARANIMIHRVGTAGVAIGTTGVPAPPPDAIAAAGPRVMYFHKEVKTTDGGSPEAGTTSTIAVAGNMMAGVTTGLASGIEPKVEQLGAKTIEGVQATGMRTTFTIPAGQIGNDKPIDITDERWYSSELQVTVLSEHSDPRTGKTSYALKNVARGEPSSTLFQVPADYTVKDAPTPFTQKLP